MYILNLCHSLCGFYSIGIFQFMGKLFFARPNDFTASYKQEYNFNK